MNLVYRTREGRPTKILRLDTADGSFVEMAEGAGSGDDKRVDKRVRYTTVGSRRDHEILRGVEDLWEMAQRKPREGSGQAECLSYARKRNDGRTHPPHTRTVRS